MPRGEGFHNLRKKKKKDFSCTQRLLYKWWPADMNAVLDTVCCHLICLRLKNENITYEYDNITIRQSDHNFWLCNLWLQWFLTCFDIESACRRISQSKGKPSHTKITDVIQYLTTPLKNHSMVHSNKLPPCLSQGTCYFMGISIYINSFSTFIQSNPQRTQTKVIYTTKSLKMYVKNICESCLVLCTIYCILLYTSWLPASVNIFRVHLSMKISRYATNKVSKNKQTDKTPVFCISNGLKQPLSSAFHHALIAGILPQSHHYFPLFSSITLLWFQGVWAWVWLPCHTEQPNAVVKYGSKMWCSLDVLGHRGRISKGKHVLTAHWAKTSTNTTHSVFTWKQVWIIFNRLSTFVLHSANISAYHSWILKFYCCL